MTVAALTEHNGLAGLLRDVARLHATWEGDDKNECPACHTPLSLDPDCDPIGPCGSCLEHILGEIAEHVPSLVDEVLRRRRHNGINDMNLLSDSDLAMIGDLK